jgi:hypothetical protein
MALLSVVVESETILGSKVRFDLAYHVFNVWIAEIGKSSNTKQFDVLQNIQFMDSQANRVSNLND